LDLGNEGKYAIPDPLGFTGKKYGTRDVVDRASTLNLAVATGDVEAIYDLAVTNLNNEVIKPSIGRPAGKALLMEIAAKELPKKRVDKKLKTLIAKANYNLGELALEDADKVKFYGKAAELDHPEACYALAKLYERGIEGAEPDYTKAREYYQKAMNAGHTAAAFDLALHYDQGIGGLKPDLTLAIDLYKRAMTGQDSKVKAAAANNLGVCYEEGRGVERNLVEAKKLYEQAARGGVEAARANLRGMQAIEEESILHGSDSNKQYELGLHYQQSARRNPVNQEKAVQYFQAAEKLGHIRAKFQMAVYYENGIVVSQDYSKARKLYEDVLASSDNSILKSNVAYALAKMHQEGRGGAPDDKEAVKYFQTALRENPVNSDAIFELAKYHEEGKVVKKDEAEAMRLYKAAIENVGHKEATERLENLQKRAKLKEVANEAAAKVQSKRAGMAEVMNTEATEELSDSRVGRASTGIDEEYFSLKGDNGTVRSTKSLINPEVNRMMKEAAELRVQSPAGWFVTSPAKKAEALYRAADRKDPGVGTDGLLALAGMYARGEAHTGFVSDRANAQRLYSEVAKSIYANTQQQQQAKKELEKLKQPQIRPTVKIHEQPSLSKGGHDSELRRTLTASSQSFDEAVSPTPTPARSSSAVRTKQ
jgi:TPR repeat protein